MHKVDKQDLASKPEDQRPRAPALRRAKTGQNNPPENLDKYPDLDPSVVAAAMTAGVEKEALQEMQKLMQTGKAKQKKLQDPAQSRVQFAPEVAAQQILSESDSDEPRDGGAGGSGEALHGGSSPVAMAVTKLTELVTALAADKLKKKVSKVEAALDGISASSVTETGGLGSGKRTAAARRALRQALQENPEEISQIIERAMLEDHKPDLHSGSTSSYAVLEGMDRAPQQNRSLEDFCSLRLDGGGCLGQVDQRRCGRMQGEARASSAHAGSDRLRQGQLVSVERAVAGEPAAYGSFESACPASGGRRRAALQPSPGSALGGGCHVSHTRDGGLCDEADEAWEEGGQRASRSETKTKGKSQGRRQARPFVRRSAVEAGGMSSPGEVAEGSSMRVPGAAAPEIDVPAFVNSWPRLLLKCNGRLAVFLHSILSATSLLCDEGTPDQALWPLPLPYPEVFRSGVNVLDGWKKRRLCLQLVVLDWLYLGQPAAAPKSLKLGQRLTPGQWRIVRLLESLADDANSIVKVDAAGMGRCASKAETQDEELGALHRALLQVQQSAPKYGGGSFSCTTFTPESEKKYAGSVVGKMTGKPFVAAKALQAERIQFGPPPSFDPFPYMDPKTASMYEQPGLFHKDAHDAPPHVSVRATAEEKMSLFLKMAACGRLKLLKADEVEEAFASGLFAVTKDLARDRLIMDSRPANCREIGLNHWCGAMANASMLGQIVLEDGEELLMSGQDVKDFFYQFVVGSERAAEIAWLVALMRVTWRSFFQIPRCHPRVALLD